MSFIQSFLTSVAPRAWAQAIEAESRAWMARCEVCRSERSIWDLGGVRWKAAGKPRHWFRCASCGRGTWHRVSRSPGDRRL